MYWLVIIGIILILIGTFRGCGNNEGDMELIERELVTKTSQVKKLESENLELKENNEILRKTNMSPSVESEPFIAGNKELMKEKETLQQQIKQHEDEKAQLIAHIDKLQERNEKLLEQMNKMKEEDEDLFAQVNTSTENQKLAHENSELKREKSRFQLQMKELEKKLKENLEANTALNSEAEKYKKQLEKTRKELAAATRAAEESAAKTPVNTAEAEKETPEAETPAKEDVKHETVTDKTETAPPAGEKTEALAASESATEEKSEEEEIPEVIYESDLSYSYDGKLINKDGKTEPGANEIFKKLVQLQKQRNFYEIADIAKKEIAQRPKWYTAYLFLAGAYANMGRNEAAVKLLEKVIADAPEDPIYKDQATALIKRIKSRTH